MNQLVFAATILDLIIGDPPALPHPVRAFGRYITLAEPIVRRQFSHTPSGERYAGSLLAASLMCGVYTIARVFSMQLRTRSPRIAGFCEVVIAATTLAAHDLFVHVDRIAQALEREDIPAARSALAHIVGRDTQYLDGPAIAAAAIESLAESFCDGIVAPLLYLACGGLPWALMYKACNTLDSMIGHREAPYTTFGTFAARADDVLNFLPARCAAIFILCGAASVGKLPHVNFNRLLNDARNHNSPNAGFPEAAIAHVLRIRLGGAVQYEGVPAERALMHATGKTSHVSDLRHAMRVVIAGTVICSAACIMFTRAR